MAKKTNDGSNEAHNDVPSSANREGGAAVRPEVSDTSRQESGHTGAGQEANRGAPGSHDDEHQSNYGGGGANGGASGSGKRGTGDTGDKA
jgi:hypothetical protein